MQRLTSCVLLCCAVLMQGRSMSLTESQYVLDVASGLGEIFQPADLNGAATPGSAGDADGNYGVGLGTGISSGTGHLGKLGLEYQWADMALQVSCQNGVTHNTAATRYRIITVHTVECLHTVRGAPAALHLLLMPPGCV